MLSLPDGVGWAPIIMGRVFVAPLFTWVLDMIPLYLQPCSRVWLINNRAVLLGETKSFQHEPVCQNCRTFVQKIFENAEFLMTMHECEEQLSYFLVFS